MYFDLRTHELAYKFLLDFLGMTGEDFNMDYIVECNKNFEIFWQKHFDTLESIDIRNLRIMAFHITATQDECAEIKENGLKNLQKVLSEDTRLKEILASYGIAFNILERTVVVKNKVININYDDYREKFRLSQYEKTSVPLLIGSILTIWLMVL